MTRPIKFLLLFVLASLPVYSQGPTVEEVLESRIHGDPNGDVEVDGQVLFSQIELPQFYTNRNYEPAWTDQKNTADLLESIESSYDEGLDPEDYHYQRIGFLRMTARRETVAKSPNEQPPILKLTQPNQAAHLGLYPTKQRPP